MTDEKLEQKKQFKNYQNDNSFLYVYISIILLNYDLNY